VVTGNHITRIAKNAFVKHTYFVETLYSAFVFHDVSISNSDSPRIPSL